MQSSSRMIIKLLKKTQICVLYNWTIKILKENLLNTKWEHEKLKEKKDQVSTVTTVLWHYVKT